MLTSTHLKPTILIFDLDETLFYSSFEERENPLSESAKRALSLSEEGQADDFELLPNIRANVKAIAHKEMQEIFDAAYEQLQKDAQNPLLAIKVITASHYKEENIKLLLDKLYGHGDKRFSTDKFPIEYYNVYQLNFFASQPSHFSHNKFLDPRKAILMAKLFPLWKEDMPGLERHRIFLIDNADYNTICAEQLGFSAILYPTTPHSRPQDVSYQKTSASIFKKLKKIITNGTKT